MAGQDPDEIPKSTWRLERLDLEVTPLPFAELAAVEGRLTLRLEGAPSPGPDLVLGEGGTFVDVSGPSGIHVETNVPAPEGADAVLARVRLPEPAEPGTTLELSFACEQPSGRSQLQVTEEVAFASWVEGWYPFPLDEERAFSALMAAPGTTTFHLPEGWDAVSNGLLEPPGPAEDGAGETTVRWRVEVPVARSFCAAPYRRERHRVGEREVGVYLLPGTTIDGARQAELLGGALAAEEARFGPYPYASYAICEVPPGPGSFYASSEQGFVMARSGAFLWDHGNLPLWAHEMAHGWWGNLVGSRGEGSILCSESLAQYGAVVAIEALEGEEAATFFLRFSRTGYSPRQCARGYFEMLRAGQDMPLSKLGSGGFMHDLSDSKGTWVYHMLRRRIGDELFFRGLRELCARYAGERMTLDDVRAHFVALAPDADLETFFAQWLDRPGAPALAVSWEAAGEGGTELRVEQLQEGEPYALDLDVALEGEGLERRERISLRERVTMVVVDVAEELVERVELDPDVELLLWRPEYGERP